MTDSKIIVVIAVLSIILLGIGVYLFYLDKKIGKLEDDFKLNQNK